VNVIFLALLLLALIGLLLAAGGVVHQRVQLVPLALALVLLAFLLTRAWP
jgi:hypothetical protein